MAIRLKPDWSMGLRPGDRIFGLLGCILSISIVTAAMVTNGFDLPPMQKIVFFISSFFPVCCFLVFYCLPMVIFGSAVLRYGDRVIFLGVFPVIGGLNIVRVTNINLMQPSIVRRKGMLSVRVLTAVIVSGSFVGSKRGALVGVRGDPYGDVLRWAEDLNRVRQAIDPDLPPVEVGPFTAWDELNLPGKPAT